MNHSTGNLIFVMLLFHFSESLASFPVPNRAFKWKKVKRTSLEAQSIVVAPRTPQQALQIKPSDF